MRNWPELLFLKFCHQPIPSQLFLGCSLCFHSFFHTGHFEQGRTLLQLGCFWVDLNIDYLFTRLGIKYISKYLSTSTSTLKPPLVQVQHLILTKYLSEIQVLWTKCAHQFVVTLVDHVISLPQYLHFGLKSPSGNTSSTWS